MAWFGYRRIGSDGMHWMFRKMRPFSPGIFAIVAGASYYTYTHSNVLPWCRKSLEVVVPIHEKRFRRFASIEYNGVLFMTPADFIQSLVKDSPLQQKIVSINNQDLKNILYRTPQKHTETSTFFRQLQTNGLVSYSEYLFLLHILTKPHSGFQIAFKMLDKDHNGCIDSREFSMLNQVITYSKRNIESNIQSNSDDLLPSKDDVFDTTLMVHLFGKRYDDTLSYDEFIRFMKNVQTEALEVEFSNYAMGASHILSTDFARILLNQTTLSVEDCKSYINRLESRLKSNQTISFKEFKDFFGFLNCLDDFSLAMRMYTIADRPISPAEFGRAVKACMGYELSPMVLQTLFALFDIDGDGCLSYQEFIHLMKERQARGLNTKVSRSGFACFRQCVAKKLLNKDN